MRRFALISGLFGSTGVILGAFGAHALRPTLLELGTRDAWQTAVLYHLLHAAALLGLAACRAHDLAPPRPDWLSWAARAWSLGIILFSGSLYALALGGPRFLGPITPLGGVAFLVGWLALVGYGANPLRSNRRP